MSHVPEMGLSAALRAMVARDVVEHPTKMADLKMRANRMGAHHFILLFEKKFVHRFEKVGIPMYAHNMVRTAAEQDALFVRNVSKARGGQSPHNFGLAVDLIHPKLAWEGMTPEMWKMVGHLGKEVAKQNGIPIIWGGDWDFYDPAHWEIADWKTLKGKYPWPPPPK